MVLAENHSERRVAGNSHHSRCPHLLLCNVFAQGIGTELVARREKIEVTRSGSPFERSPVPVGRAHRPYTREFRASPENRWHVRLVGGWCSLVRTPLLSIVNRLTP
jgi:hypothetical protein